MPSRPYALYRNFARLNEAASPESLQDNELLEALNVDYDEAGGISKRKGIAKVNAVPYDTNPIKRLIDYSKKGQHLVASGTTLRKIDGTVIKSDFVNTDFDWEVFSDGNLYLVNGNNYYAYDGTICSVVIPATGTTLDHIKRCKYIVQRGQRLFAAGDSQYPNSIYFSEVGAANNFPATNVINAVSDDNDVLTGLAEFHSALVAYKKRHVYAWFGWDPATNVRFDKINVHTGTDSHFTIKRAYNNLLYKGSDGAYALFGLETNYISSISLTDEVTKPRFKGLIDTDKAWAEFYDGKYLLSVRTTGTYNNLVLVYDLIRKAWAVWEGWKASCFSIYDNELYIGSGETGIVYKRHDSYNDDGAPIYFKIATKPFDCGFPLHEKKFSWFYLLVGEASDANAIDVSLYCDYKTVRLHNGIQLNTVRVPGANLFDEEVPEGRTRLYYKRAKMLARSLRAQAVVENNELDEGITIYGIGFQFWPIEK